MSVCWGQGNLCNHVIRNLAFSIIAEKFNLSVTYENKEFIPEIEKLGINLYSGEKKYKKREILLDKDYLKIYNQENIDYNLYSNNEQYYQTNNVAKLLYEYLYKDKIKNKIIENNPFRERYNNNNDVFIHCRLGDAPYMYPGINYVKKCISEIDNFDTMYVASNEFQHAEIKKLQDIYPMIIFVEKSRVETIQFGSTCKHIILSNGSFSGVIGLLSFFSNIYYPCNMMNWSDGWTINNWKKIKC
jgi:hypothetical protein